MLTTNQTSFQDVLENESCTKPWERVQAYLESVRCGTSLSVFWMSNFDMVEILLGLVRASREDDWILHLASIRKMILWCFAYDKVNYARFLTYYLVKMSHLPIEHPEVYAHFMDGGFSVQIGKQNPFGRIPVD